MADITHPQTGDPLPPMRSVHVSEHDADIDVESKSAASTEIEQQREKDKETTALMRRQLRSIIEGTSAFRKAALDDSQFRMGEFNGKRYQWIDEIAIQRDEDGRPCITINKAPGTIHQITNQARQARLRIHVSPVDDRGDVKTAETLQGMIRNAENYSFADRAYYMASDKQAEQGLGYIFLTTENATDDPDDTENLFRVRLRIKQVMDPLSIYTDASAEEPDFSDADFQFKVTDVDLDTWVRVTGRDAADAPTSGMLETVQDENAGDWFPNKKIRMVQWWNRESRGEKKRMALMSNGDVIPYPDANTLARYQSGGHKIKRDRTVQKRVMVWRTCDALDIHETTEWPGGAVPNIPVIGDALWCAGQRDFRGALRDGKSAAMVYNVHVSGLTEAVGIGQKAPVVGVEGQFGAPDSPMNKAWKSHKPKKYLEYKKVQIAPGQFANAPAPMQFELPLEGILMAIHQSDEDYKTTTGQHDASLGERGPQEAARAIEARKQQDTLGNSHYLDNLRYALASLGRQAIKCLRVIVDAPMVVRITGNDDQQRNVMVYAGQEMDPRAEKWLQTHPADAREPHTLPDGSMVQPGQQIPFQLPKGVKEILDIGTGEFDVEVNAGPDPGTSRQHDLELLTEVFKTMPPELAMKFLDLEFSLIDSAVGRQLAERAKKLLPQELRDDDDDKPQIPPEALAKMQQLTEQRDAAMKAAQQMQQEIRTKKYAVDAGVLTAREKNQMQFRIEALKQRMALIVQKEGIKSEQALAIFEANVKLLEAQQAREHAQQMSLLDAQLMEASNESDRRIDQAGADADRALEQAESDADRQLQAELAVLGHSVTAATPVEEPTAAEGQ